MATPSLRPGLERREEFRVEASLVTDVSGTLAVRVLSTPGMIGMMERTATRAVREHLPPGHTTVGFEVCVRHVAGAPEGARCEAHATLVAVDGRKLRFEVQVRALDGGGAAGRVIGLGTHERRMIDVERHAGRVGGQPAAAC